MTDLDEDLLARFHAGEEKLFEALVDQHTPRLLLVARAFSSHEEEARDLVQETWVRAYRKRRSYRSAGSLFGWLAAVCRSIALNRLRAAGRRPADRLDDHASAAVAASGGPGVAGAEIDAEAVRRNLHRALLELGERRRQVVLLRLVEGRTTAETAERLGIAEGTVKATLHQALAALRAQLQEWQP